ncbi:uncharacterized protein LOC133664628 isoform X2 [Entelurus aequoreus]|uniref:uncharacterized protein LOC133664628 isoform X2 n=1 Tax=Entelurus aequoreus TaxID=161455 RepID=UPI002B1DEB8D|nr:uncharacterized protein LOC133664628 isoform X2 [Entelurus aequoreus]
MCERTIAKYEEELCPTKEKKERQHQLLDAVFQKHRVVLHRTDIQQPPHIKEEEEDPQPPHMKEEEEEVWITQEGECLLGQEEDDVTKFPLTVVSVKTEEHEDKPPESSQLHHSPNIQRVSAGSHEEEWHTSVGQKELQAPSHIKEEQLHDEDEAQSLQLHHSQSEENRGAELTSSGCQRVVMKRFPPGSGSGTPVWDRRSYRPPPTLKRSSFMMKMKLSPYSFITVKVRRTEGRSL